MNSKSQKRIFTFVLCAGLGMAPTFALAKSGKKEIRAESLSVNHLRIVNNNQSDDQAFEAEKLQIEQVFYIPEGSLVMDRDSVQNWTKRVSYPFQVASGENTVVHLQTRYFSDWKNIDPFYAMQLNLEVPSALFRSRSDVDFKNLKAYLTWTRPNTIDSSDYYATLKSGHLKIWKIKNGTMRGWLNFKFEHDGKIVQVYGSIKSRAKSREAYVNEQESIRHKLYDQATQLGE